MNFRSSVFFTQHIPTSRDAPSYILSLSLQKWSQTRGPLVARQMYLCGPCLNLYLNTQDFFIKISHIFNNVSIDLPFIVKFIQKNWDIFEKLIFFRDLIVELRPAADFFLLWMWPAEKLTTKVALKTVLVQDPCS